ncbi:MAG: phosphoribosylglycinamide formyltransferase [Muribaculaceae bacterium]|nr:phosphoribosylglycinamide formyltransferase [Muribaculaceae bacterium]
MKETETKRKIAIFASGNGSNAENIIRYFNHRAERGGEVTLVVCNKREAGVIARAEALGVPVSVLTKEEINNPDIIIPLLEKHNVYGIVLAGFLLMIPTFLISKYPDRIINIHPSLLPKYGGKGMYGANVHRAVVENGEKETGITIHRVSDECDKGSIIFQAKVAVEPGDSAETVESKIHRLEKEHFPRVVEEVFMQP